jgi:non-canonical purine NTP pyrophosphatase (RdgB/HAM1 family)
LTTFIRSRRFEVLIATRNPGKIREIQEAFMNLPVTLRYLKDFPRVSTVQETGKTYKENAILKALNYSKQTGMCALADDSGLEVDALGGLPGVYSARFWGALASDGERTHKLLAALSQYPNRTRTAHFVCCLALVEWKRGELDSAAGAEVLSVAEGRCEGLIAHESRGANGFGFDPVFIPLGYDATFGEMSSDVKSVISHRAKALALTREFLDGWVTST